MKPADQMKVIALAFFSIIVMIGIITTVSMMTTNAVASHGGGHGTETHSTGGEHGDPDTSAGSMAQDQTHSDAGHSASQSGAEHTGEAKPAEQADSHSADKGAETQTAAAGGGNAEAGAKVFMAKTCATCHTVAKVKATGTIGPKLDGLGATAAKRVPGKSAEEYIKESIENPNAHIAEGYQPMMPSLRANMSDQEFHDLVAFLASL